MSVPATALQLEIQEEICDRIANGESLKTILRSPGMPTRAMIHRWLYSSKDFHRDFTIAEQLKADLICDEIMEIADEGHPSSIHLDNAKLRIKTRQWVCAKLNPSKYSEKIKTEITGKDDTELKVILEIVRPNDGLPVNSLAAASRSIREFSH